MAIWKPVFTAITKPFCAHERSTPVSEWSERTFHLHLRRVSRSPFQEDKLLPPPPVQYKGVSLHTLVIFVSMTGKTLFPGFSLWCFYHW